MIELMRMTLRDPLGGFRVLKAKPWQPGDRWALIFATAACSAILSWLSGALLAAPGEGPGVLGFLSASPISMASVQVVSAAFGAYLLAEVGRIFGGTGRFSDALLAVGWVEAIMSRCRLCSLSSRWSCRPSGRFWALRRCCWLPI